MKQKSGGIVMKIIGQKRDLAVKEKESQRLREQSLQKAMENNCSIIPSYQLYSPAMKHSGQSYVRMGASSENMDHQRTIPRNI